MKGRRAGFTLIEVLIAISLVSLLSVAMLISIRIGLNSQEKANTRLARNRRAVGAQRALEQEMNGFMPAVALWPTPDGMAVRRISFFIGDAQSMRFVSSFSLNGANRSTPQLLEYAVVPGETGAGFRLIVNELPYRDGYSAGARISGFEQDANGIPVPAFFPIELGPHSFVLADRLAYCRMLYLGLEQNPVRREWRDDWNRRRWPLAVRVEMRPLEVDPARLAPMTVTVPIFAERDPDKTYNDDPGLK